MSYSRVNLTAALFAILAGEYSRTVLPPSLIRKLQPSWLEQLTSRLYDSYRSNSNLPTKGYISPSVRVPFHRGIRREQRKNPAAVPQLTHGYRTPRSDYRKVAEPRG